MGNIACRIAAPPSGRPLRFLDAGVGIAPHYLAAYEAGDVAVRLTRNILVGPGRRDPTSSGPNDRRALYTTAP